MADETTYRPAPLIPRTPTQVREEMVRHRVESARRAGVDASPDQVERGVLRDLELVEGLKRGQDTTRHRHRHRSPRSGGRRAQQTLDKRPDEGLKLVTPSGNFERPPLLHAPALAIGLKWSAAVARIGRIVEGTAPAPTPEQAVATAACPDLALEWWKTYADYRLRHRLSRHNLFLGLSERDAARKLVRIVMDLCDRSTGRLGPWWVR